MEITISPVVTDEDARGKAIVHWKTWQAAYAGLIPDSYLHHPAFPERCEKLAMAVRDGTLIAKAGEQVIGFAAFGAYRGDDLTDTAELDALYVLPEYWGRGVGYALMNAAAEAVAGQPRIALWVLDGNERAIRFYERYGFRFDGAEMSIKLGEPRTVHRMILEREEKPKD
ncbi:MAG: GNAT family N-acetyltransferase [Clostridiales bacterium]|nr:GNAT family N-acetyltransferase [Clostridiales bacterium]